MGLVWVSVATTDVFSWAHRNTETFKKLVEICTKVSKNRGFFEWDTIDGMGQGSSHYSGSAATLTRSIIEGLFGIRWDIRDIRIEPRLGTRNGYIFAPNKENGEFIAYSYEVVSGKPWKEPFINICFGSNSRSPKILVIPILFQGYQYHNTTVNRATLPPNELTVSDSCVEISLDRGRSDIPIEFH
jgi:hypothetical protein